MHEWHSTAAMIVVLKLFMVSLPLLVTTGGIFRPREALPGQDRGQPGEDLWLSADGAPAAQEREVQALARVLQRERVGRELGGVACLLAVEERLEVGALVA